MAAKIRFLCDENVRNDVASFLVDRGHEVIFSREALSVSAPDQLLTILGAYHGLVILTHDNDFKQYRKMLPETERNSFSRGAGRLLLKVDNPQSLKRVKEEIKSIEFHFEQALERGTQFDMTIQTERISVR